MTQLNSSEKASGKRAYQQIDLDKRQELIECVIQKKETMKDCAKRLWINYCTAKHILKVYRRTGSFETDLMRKKKEKDEELRQKVLNDSQFADYALKEYGIDTENNHELNSNNQSSTQEVMSLKDDNSHHEESHNHSSESGSDEYMPVGARPYQPEAQVCLHNPNFLFENPNVEFHCAQFEEGPQLSNLWRYLGDLIYMKHSQ